MARPIVVPILLAVALVGIVPAASSADADIIQPGDAISTSVGGCTLSFVFDGVGALAGKTYVSTAAHCVRGLGDPISATGASDFATVVRWSPPAPDGFDWAILEVKSAFVGKLDAGVKGRPGMPNGVASPSETVYGDLLHFSGYGMGFSVTAATRESRSGVLLGQGDKEYRTEAPIIFGDSGGPVLHESGQAMGIVSRIAGTHDIGPTIDGMLEDLDASGFPLALRTV